MVVIWLAGTTRLVEELQRNLRAELEIPLRRHGTCSVAIDKSATWATVLQCTPSGNRSFRLQPYARGKEERVLHSHEAYVRAERQLQRKHTLVGWCEYRSDYEWHRYCWRPLADPGSVNLPAGSLGRELDPDSTHILRVNPAISSSVLQSPLLRERRPTLASIARRLAHELCGPEGLDAASASMFSSLGSWFGARVRSVSQERVAGAGSAITVAIGVILSPHRYPSSGFRDASPPGAPIAWRWVITPTYSFVTDTDFVSVPCPDSPETDFSKQFSCSCKTLWWFRKALALWPAVPWVGKVEDDTVVHGAQLVRELVWASATLPFKWMWYGPFQLARHASVPPYRDPWTGAPLVELHRLAGRYCSGLERAAPRPGGVRVDVRALLSGSCELPADATDSVLAPFATGAMDVRNRAFAHLIDSCPQIVTDQRGAGCDGWQGWAAARCLDGSEEQLGILHLPATKFGSRRSVNNNTVVVHNEKAWGFAESSRGMNAGVRRPEAKREHEREAVRWQVSASASLPFVMSARLNSTVFEWSRLKI